MVRLVVFTTIFSRPSVFKLLSVAFILNLLPTINAINRTDYLQLIIKPKEKKKPQIINTLHRNRIAIIDYLLIM
jgi:hypothetical protein